MHVCDWTLEFGSNTDISNFENSLGVITLTVTPIGCMEMIGEKERKCSLIILYL